MQRVWGDPGGVIATGLVLVVLMLTGCATQVERLSPDEARDLSGKWNDTDSRLVSGQMVQEMADRPWLERFHANQDRPPVVIVGEVNNLSHEHINVQTFVNDIERALINAGRVTFVADAEKRQTLREERKTQELHAREDTRKAMGQELGADFMLTGSINTILDKENNRQVRFYQVDLNLIDLADNRKVWAGQKKIKKFVTKPRMRF